MKIILDFVATLGIIALYIIAIAVIYYFLDWFLYGTNVKYRKWYNKNVYGIKTSNHFDREFIIRSLEMNDEEFEIELSK